MDMVKKGGDKLGVNNSKNNAARASIPDVMQSNGVIDVIDTVLMPSCPPPGDAST